MQIIVTGRVIPTTELEHGVEGGRFWYMPLYYLYPLAWDPYILSLLGTVPDYRESHEPLNDPGDALHVLSHATTSEDSPLLQTVLGAGGHVVLNHPPVDLLTDLGVAVTREEPIISLRERWHLPHGVHGPYIYPHTQPFLQLDPHSGTVLSRIGGNPDLLVHERLGVFAGDVTAAVETYQFMPDRMSHLMADLAATLVEMVSCFMGQPLAPRDRRGMARHHELRRDFHAFGFAYLTVRELDRCHGGGHVDLGDARDTVLAAAKSLTRSTREAKATLRRAFEALERENRKLQPDPAIFTDTLHGGELYPDIGYFEIDWPEHPADVLRTYLDWAETRSYRFNVDLGATTVRELARRFPDLFERIRRQQARGRIEFVNGSCNQPYPPFHSLESQIRQFDIGREVWRDVLDTHPATYASQEFGFCPQMAAVLKQQGYDGAVVRVQNMGDAPTLRDEVISWKAPSGDRLLALPSHPHKSEQRNEFTYNNLHLKLFLHGRDNLDFAVFTCLGDITYHRYLREEMIRVCHYAPVFGHFDTLQRYFRNSRRKSAPETTLSMTEFNCDAAFINLGIWSMYKRYTGNYNSNCINSMRATSRFAAAEMLDAIKSLIRGGDYETEDHAHNWEALTHYQGHGTYIVPYYMSGGFQGTGDSPENRDAGRGCQYVAEYLGPIDFRQVKEVTDNLMADGDMRARSVMLHHLGAEAPSSSCGAYRLFCFAPEHERLVRIPGAAGVDFAVAGAALAGQDDGADRLVLTPLPSYGTALLQPIDPNVVPQKAAVQAGSDFLENELIRAEFDLERGSLHQLIQKCDGRPLLGPDSATFSFPHSKSQRCVHTSITQDGPLRASITFDLEIAGENGELCRVTSLVSLDINSPVLDFTLHVVEAPHLEGDQWENHLGINFHLGHQATNIETSHFNVLEPFHRDKIYSPNLLLARTDSHATVFLNRGNQFHVRNGEVLRQILVMENEAAREFCYAVGAAEVNPIMQARRWAAEIFVHDADTLGGNDADESLVAFSSPDVELLSCRRDQDALLFRMANTCSRRVKTEMRLARPIGSAQFTMLNGQPGRSLAVHQGHVTIPLRPWDVRQVRVELG